MKFDINEFNKTYKGTNAFIESSKYFQLFIDAITNNNDLLNHIIFNNDVMSIPPVLTFIKYYKDTFNTKLSTNDKRGLGAAFGFLFKNILGYTTSTLSWVGDKVTGIKNASYFTK